MVQEAPVVRITSQTGCVRKQVLASKPLGHRQFLYIRVFDIMFVQISTCGEMSKTKSLARNSIFFRERTHHKTLRSQSSRVTSEAIQPPPFIVVKRQDHGSYTVRTCGDSRGVVIWTCSEPGIEKTHEKKKAGLVATTRWCDEFDTKKEHTSANSRSDRIGNTTQCTPSCSSAKNPFSNKKPTATWEIASMFRLRSLSTFYNPRTRILTLQRL